MARPRANHQEGLASRCFFDSWEPDESLKCLRAKRLAGRSCKTNATARVRVSQAVVLPLAHSAKNARRLLICIFFQHDPSILLQFQSKFRAQNVLNPRHIKPRKLNRPPVPCSYCFSSWISTPPFSSSSDTTLVEESPLCMPATLFSKSLPRLSGPSIVVTTMPIAIMAVATPITGP